ncbi:MAG: efflux RND transporter periplasmic adaptor subunit [Gemmatimonadetes bacterium]|jgi:membrane fusion protein, multidrug efflux system|nr:efflux RND transporter periplasmic adaptor subunit [Gemmatimonadota bacterium]MBT6146581.1 efflux RND transporter periplasmic adaptor subunit [Gemmatimonadota bacterium]MBT7862845.1 efflux RND transporter periplasmic adaptor subunit [Gemmatimonadota bacterium]
MRRLLCVAATAATLVFLFGVTDLSAQRPPAGVIVAEILTQPVVQDLTLVGSVHPRRVTIVASQTDGIVVGRAKEAGQTVRRNEAIYRLDNDQLRAGLIAALADVKLHRFRQEQSAQLLAQNAISEDAALETEVELDRARSQLQDLQSRLDDLTIRAPFDGHIVEPLVELGQWVNRGDGVVRVVSTDTVRVYVNVPERHVSQLQLGQEVDVVIGALGTDIITARIVAILAQGYADSHTFPVVVEFLNPTGRIRAGMAARVNLSVQQPGDVLLVHKDAVVNSVRGTFLFVAQDGSAVQRTVQTGLAHQGYVAVEGDLQPGELAIVRGNERLQDGQAIRVVRKLQ